MKTHLYLTSTFTNPWNVAFNPQIGKALEDLGFICYLPHRDTDQKGSEKEIFAADLEGLRNTSCVLAIALHETPNWGAELGYAYSLNKPIVALTEREHAVPLICQGMVTETVRVENLNDIDSYISSLVEILRQNTG